MPDKTTEPAVTPGAAAAAAELGVDPTTVKGSGPGGKVTKADVAAAATGNWYYSLDPKHVAPDLVDERRFFQWDAPAETPDACPEENGKQVNAIPVPAKGAYPTSILEVAARLAQK